MLAIRLTGYYTVAAKSDSRKASIHAGFTGLTGLSGYAGAHVCEMRKQNQRSRVIKNLSVCAMKTMLTLLTPIKASIHAGFSVTGFSVNTVIPRNEA